MLLTLNSKREYDKAYSILKDVKKEISLLKTEDFHPTLKKIITIGKYATYEIIVWTMVKQ